MAYDKRFGIDIPTDDQVKAYMTKLQMMKGLDRQIRILFAKDSLPHKAMGLKCLQELAKLAKYYDNEQQVNNTNIMFLTRAESDAQWAEDARQHDKLLAERAETDLATHKGDAKGDEEQSRDSDRHTG